ncbi:MAG: NAD(P)/FAD-dependent oxidoreductase [Lachnospiraceae bacterium]|nr:NAD(P)/FAD-dependent oxidoreductase [Lachnospiraceae bacterium]
MKKMACRKKVGIIGGGASGMAAAITAARLGAEVTILERNDRIGKKILVTGNGKCNLGNYHLTPSEYYGENPAFIEKALQRFNTEDTIAFFNSMGLLIKERNGYLYPACEQAAVVLDVLRYELQALGVTVITECKINSVAKDGKTGKIVVSDGVKQYHYDAVVLACGSKAAPKTGSDGSGYKLAKQLGHHIVPTVPALVQLKCREDYFKAVAGVRADAVIKIYDKGKCVAKERGELQLTEYGISGIPVFQISRVANYILRDNSEVLAEINFLSDMSEDTYKKFCEERRRTQKGRTAEEFFTGMLHKKIMALFLKMAGIKGNIPISEAEEEKMQQVFALCKKFRVHINGSNPYDNAQVCAGGVDTMELTEDMESCKMPGVFLAGELLDVDGKCGGYNLQWAWSSGTLAGRAAASGDIKG